MRFVGKRYVFMNNVMNIYYNYHRYHYCCCLRAGWFVELKSLLLGGSHHSGPDVVPGNSTFVRSTVHSARQYTTRSVHRIVVLGHDSPL